uniref:SFRICE_015165 n=1 Tax=Spodoptera frugiperda TaxID=7108 RepID=A0A2H1WKV0_SPOFR
MKSCLDIVLHSHSIVVSLSVIIQRISDNRRANGDWLNGRLASRATGVEEKKMAKWCDPLIVSGRLNLDLLLTDNIKPQPGGVVVFGGNVEFCACDRRTVTVRGGAMAAGSEFVEGWLVAQVLGEGAYGELGI